MIVKEIERVGIPTVQITAVVDIAKSMGISRILRGFAITSPVGNPIIGSSNDEKVSRKKYIEKALEILQKKGNAGAVNDI